MSDVIIVGGGPTGLFLASELALGGVRATVLERRTEIVGQPRALGLSCRTFEVLELRGLGPRFLARAVTLPVGFFGSLTTPLDLSPLDTTYPITLLIPQTVTEALLEERARELGVDLRRGWKVETVRQTGDGVRISGANGGGSFTIDARYVVGADGARSVVRDQSGIGFTGKDADTTMYFGDLKMVGAPVEGSFTRENEEGSVLVAAFGEGRYRLVFVDPSRFSIPLSEPVTLEEIQAAAHRFIGPDVVVSEPTWLSRFGNETRLADSYRRGRVFLAGDAAHIHIPAGGQGMNTGVQDALNLGWKLAAVLRGHAPEAILASYERERRPVGAQVIENSLAQGAVIACAGMEGDALRRLMNRLLQVPEANRQMTELLSATGVTYPEPLLEGHDVGAPEYAGKRVTNYELRRANGETVELYGFLNEGDWLELRITPDAADCPLPPGIAPSWVKHEAAVPTDERSFLRGLSSVLIRPDGYVAFARRNHG